MRRRQRELRQGITIGLLSLLALWIGSLVFNLGGKAEIAWREARSTQVAYTTLETRKQELAGNLATLETPRGQEAAIRDAFGVAKPGEEVIILVPSASSTPTTTPPWWRRVFNWF